MVTILLVSPEFKISWVVTLCHWASSSHHHLLGLLDPEDEGTVIL